MSSTFMGLETAKRSLFTQTAALNTTGHNIANANTKGYSRQVVNMVASQPMEAPSLTRSNTPGQLGTGVEYTSVTRIRENFLDDQYRNENKKLGSTSIQQDTLSKLEKIFNEPSDTGLQSVLGNFWSSWSDLSKDPENTDARKVVRENAMALTDTFQYVSKSLSDLSNDLTTNINVKVSEINTKTAAIADLNEEIQRIEGLGDDANDLRDQRDQLTDDLSKIASITVQRTDQGYNISLGSTNLVAGKTATETSGAALESAYASGDLSGGEVYGMIVSRDKYVKDYQTELDTIANTIANGPVTVTIPKGSVLPEGTVISGVTYSGASRTLTDDLTVQVNGINGLHKLGYTNLNGSLSTAGDFFTSSDGSSVTASTIQVSEEIRNDVNEISTSMRTSTSGSTESVVVGNNSMALLISQLKDTKFSFTKNGVTTTATVNDYYNSDIGQLGVQAEQANRSLQNQQALVDQVESSRQSISGVSLDEEMSNLIKFQHAYSAAARVMTTFDEMLDKVINSMGTVGR
ncbi:flagellar hook-associated protein FlgK [Paenibacillus hexagrammi]|uniref:Flagellar hook-associated protein 1 n=1 Tax=Paenibacillus hexagrammi TaxID=2908839 RepID=A0ABY3SHN4_9BACL|nr:flagellar hook-associated protein FlgK [Paenibacillus sp. YPD9-1]UJF33229.1 flagellar hook-associated protein FlgK [Paenibacillus sp. YPD9-1]